MDGDIVFHDVSFRYNETKEVLSHINLTIKSGTTFGILGATGSGKSTLMYLLDRLYELPTENGTITIGGVDIRHIALPWLRGHIGIGLTGTVPVFENPAGNYFGRCEKPRHGGHSPLCPFGRH